MSFNSSLLSWGGGLRSDNQRCKSEPKEVADTWRRCKGGDEVSIRLVMQKKLKTLKKPPAAHVLRSISHLQIPLTSHSLQTRRHKQLDRFATEKRKKEFRRFPLKLELADVWHLSLQSALNKINNSFGHVWTLLVPNALSSLSMTNK